MSSKPGAQVNQSIIDGISVLQALAMSGEPVGSRELARRLNLETTRVNRLLKTLASIGITQQNANRKYTSGPGMHVLATQGLYASGLLRSAIGPLEKLAFFGKTVALGVLWHDSVSFLYHARPGMSAGEAIGRIGLRSASASGIGMALLAAAEPESVIKTYTDADIPGFPGGIDELIAELDVIRRQDYARVQVAVEGQPDPKNPTHTIAVSVGQPVSSAIAVSGWIPEESMGDIVAALHDAREAIESSMLMESK